MTQDELDALYKFNVATEEEANRNLAAEPVSGGAYRSEDEADMFGPKWKPAASPPPPTQGEEETARTETPERTITYPGQAHFAIPGAEHRCFECRYWTPRRKDDKKAVCLKAAALMRNASPPLVPRNAVICKYFEERKG